jgi:hypothetical protein
MNKVISALMCVVLIAGLSGVAFADLTQSATTRVAYNVVPTVGITVQTPAIPDYQITDNVLATGPKIDVVFSIHSNSEQLQFTAGATRLYKGGVNTSPYYLIPTKGVNFACANASIIDGATNLQPYGSATTVNEWDALQAGPVVFESATRGTFSQLCTLTFQWASIDLELPPGQYSGYVKLIASVVPVGEPALGAPVLR